MRRHGDKITYVLIAFAVCLILMALSTYKTTRMANTILYTSVAISLLAENIPKVVEIPLQYVHPVRCIEYFMYYLSDLCFITVLLRHLPGPMRFFHPCRPFPGPSAATATAVSAKVFMSFAMWSAASMRRRPREAAMPPLA